MEPFRKMNFRQAMFLVAGVALLGVAFIVCPRWPKEPVYQGKPLTQWIVEAHDVGIFEQTEETDAAMRAMGTNAVPFLLKEFTRPIYGWRERFCVWVSSLPVKIHLRTDEERIHLAGNGLILLETNVATALPILARYLDDPIRGVYVMDIFACQGNAALHYLTAGLASTNAVTITNVRFMLQRMTH